MADTTYIKPTINYITPYLIEVNLKWYWSDVLFAIGEPTLSVGSKQLTPSLDGTCCDHSLVVETCKATGTYIFTTVQTSMIVIRLACSSVIWHD